MQPQGESIWGNINLCIEIALDIYFMIGENGEGIVVPKERAEEVFSEKTVEAGKEADGCLYYPKGDTMEMPLYEMMQKRAALARKMEIAAAKQMEQIRGNGSGAADSLFAKIAPPAETEYVICCARDGIYLTGGNEMQLLVAEQLAEHFLTPYACEFARNENGYYHFPLQAGAIALHELKTVFPECKEWIISEESLNATICQCYPTYRTDYNAIVSEQEQIPDVKAPINLFLQKQYQFGYTNQESQSTSETEEEGIEP